MKISALAFALIVAGMAAAAAALPQGPGYAWKHLPGREVTLLRDGEPLWVFHYDPKEDWPYFHPIRLPGGPVMTGLSPADHPWHRALWFSWKFIDGINYWEYRDLKDPKSESAGRTEFAGGEDVRTGKDGATIALDIEYRDRGGVHLREKRRIRIEMPRSDGSYAIDWEGVFTVAGPDVELNKDTGYAGLFFRASPNWREPRYLNSEGISGPAVRQAAAKWIDLSGIDASGFGPFGVTLFDHPGNPRFPAPWWRDRSPDDDEIAYIGTGLLFSGPLKVTKSAPLRLRYRIYVHGGRPVVEALDGEFRKFEEGR
jgi:hypothetical protein